MPRPGGNNGIELVRLRRSFIHHEEKSDDLIPYSLNTPKPFSDIRLWWNKQQLTFHQGWSAGIANWWNAKVSPWRKASAEHIRRVSYDIYSGTATQNAPTAPDAYSDKVKLLRYVEVHNLKVYQSDRKKACIDAINTEIKNVNAQRQSLRGMEGFDQTNTPAEALDELQDEKAIVDESKTNNFIDRMLDACTEYEETPAGRGQLTAIRDSLVRSRRRLECLYLRLDGIKSVLETIADKEKNLDFCCTSPQGQLLKGHFGGKKFIDNSTPGTNANGQSFLAQIHALSNQGLPNKAYAITTSTLMFGTISAAIIFGLGIPITWPAMVCGGLALVAGGGSATAGFKNIGKAIWYGAYGKVIGDAGAAGTDDGKRHALGGFAWLAMGTSIGALVGTILLPGIGTIIGAGIGCGFAMITSIGIKNIARALRAFFWGGLIGGVVRGIEAGIVAPNKSAKGYLATIIDPNQSDGIFPKSKDRSHISSSVGWFFGGVFMVITCAIRELLCLCVGAIAGAFAIAISGLAWSTEPFSFLIDAFWAQEDAQSNFRSPLAIAGAFIGGLVCSPAAIVTGLIRGIIQVIILLCTGIKFLYNAIKDSVYNFFSGFAQGFISGFKRGFLKADAKDEFNNLISGQQSNASKAGIYIGAALPWMISGLLKGIIWSGWASGIVNGFNFIAHPKDTAKQIAKDYTAESKWAWLPMIAIGAALAPIVVPLRIVVDLTVGFFRRIFSFADAGYHPNTMEKYGLAREYFNNDNSWIESIAGVAALIPAAIIAYPVALITRCILDVARAWLGSIPAYFSLGWKYNSNDSRVLEKAASYRSNYIPSEITDNLMPSYDEDDDIASFTSGNSESSLVDDNLAPVESKKRMDRPLSQWATYLNPLGWIAAGIGAIITGLIEGACTGALMGGHYICSSEKDDIFGDAPKSYKQHIKGKFDIYSAWSKISRTWKNPKYAFYHSIPIIVGQILQSLAYTVSSALSGIVFGSICFVLRGCKDFLFGLKNGVVTGVKIWLNPENTAYWNELEKHVDIQESASLPHMIGTLITLIVTSPLIVIREGLVMPMVGLVLGCIGGFAQMVSLITEGKSFPGLATLWNFIWRSDPKKGERPWNSPFGALAFGTGAFSAAFAFVIPIAVVYGFVLLCKAIYHFWRNNNITDMIISGFQKMFNGLVIGANTGAKFGFYLLSMKMFTDGFGSIYNAGKDLWQGNSSWLGLIPGAIAFACIAPIALAVSLLHAVIYEPLAGLGNGLKTIYLRHWARDRVQKTFWQGIKYICGKLAGHRQEIVQEGQQQGEGSDNESDGNTFDPSNFETRWTHKWSRIRPIAGVFALIGIGLATVTLATYDFFKGLSLSGVEAFLSRVKTNPRSFIAKNYDQMVLRWRQYQPAIAAGHALGFFVMGAVLALYDIVAGFTGSLWSIAKRFYNKNEHGNAWSETMKSFAGYKPQVAIAGGSWLLQVKRGWKHIKKAIFHRPLALTTAAVTTLLLGVPTAILSAFVRCATYGIPNEIYKGYTGDHYSAKQEFDTQSRLVRWPSLIFRPLGWLAKGVTSLASFVWNNKWMSAGMLVFGPGYLIIKAAKRITWNWLGSPIRQSYKLYKDFKNHGGYAHLPQYTIPRRVLIGIPVVGMIFKVFAKIAKKAAQHGVSQHGSKYRPSGFVRFFAPPKYVSGKHRGVDAQLEATLIKALTDSYSGQRVLNSDGNGGFTLINTGRSSHATSVGNRFFSEKETVTVLKQLLNMVRTRRYSDNHRHPVNKNRPYDKANPLSCCIPRGYTYGVDRARTDGQTVSFEIDGYTLTYNPQQGEHLQVQGNYQPAAADADANAQPGSAVFA